MEVQSNWLIIPYGTHTRYFDKAAGVYRLKFMPLGHLFSKSETMDATRFIKQHSMHFAKLLWNITVTFMPFGFDASNAFRSGLLGDAVAEDAGDSDDEDELDDEDADEPEPEDDDEDDAGAGTVAEGAAGAEAEESAAEGAAARPLRGDEFYTDYAHVMRKLTQEEGPARLADRDESLPYLKEAVNQLHLCTSLEQHRQLAEIVVDEMNEMGETRFTEYAMKTGSGYFTEPWNRWFIAAPRLVLEDGGRSGSVIAYHNVGPTTNPGEHYNLEIQETVLLNKRSSKEHLLGKALPEQVLLDATDRASTWPMVFDVTEIPTESLNAALSIIEDNKRKVFNGTGPTPDGHKFPVGTKIYFNNVDARLQDVTATRVIDCESSFKGVGYKKDARATLKSFAEKHMSLNCAEKLKNGTWICRCHQWQYQGRCSRAVAPSPLTCCLTVCTRCCACARGWRGGGHCPEATAALELDGRIIISQLLTDMPANNIGGRPTKNKSGREKQPAPVNSMDAVIPPGQQEHRHNPRRSSLPDVGRGRSASEVLRRAPISRPGSNFSVAKSPCSSRLGASCDCHPPPAPHVPSSPRD